MQNKQPSISVCQRHRSAPMDRNKRGDRPFACSAFLCPPRDSAGMETCTVFGAAAKTHHVWPIMYKLNRFRRFDQISNKFQTAGTLFPTLPAGISGPNLEKRNQHARFYCQDSSNWIPTIRLIDIKFNLNSLSRLSWAKLIVKYVTFVLIYKFAPSTAYCKLSC